MINHPRDINIKMCKTLSGLNKFSSEFFKNPNCSSIIIKKKRQSMIKAKNKFNILIVDDVTFNLQALKG